MLKGSKMTMPIELIAQEARANRTVLMTARKSDGTTVTREIEPYSLRPGADGSPNLFYHCLLRNALRNSRVSDIISATPTSNSFAPRWPVEF